MFKEQTFELKIFNGKVIVHYSIAELIMNFVFAAASIYILYL